MSKVSKRSQKLAPTRAEKKGRDRLTGKPGLAAAPSSKHASSRSAAFKGKAQLAAKAKDSSAGEGRDTGSRRRDREEAQVGRAERGRARGDSKQRGGSVPRRERSSTVDAEWELDGAKKAKDRAGRGGRLQDADCDKGSKNRKRPKGSDSDEDLGPDEEELVEELQYDFWQDHYYGNELNVADETLLDVLVDVIKRRHGRHYYGKCLPASVAESSTDKVKDRQAEGDASRASAASTSPPSGGPTEDDQDASRTEEELKDLTSDALLIKKAWAFVAEDAAAVRAEAGCPVSASPAAQKSCKSKNRLAQRRPPRGDGGQGEVRSEENGAKGLPTRWQCFLERRLQRLEIERLVQQQIAAVLERDRHAASSGDAPGVASAPSEREREETADSNVKAEGDEAAEEENSRAGEEVVDESESAGETEPDRGPQKRDVEDPGHTIGGAEGRADESSPAPALSAVAETSSLNTPDARADEPVGEAPKTEASQPASPLPSRPMSHGETPRDDDDEASEEVLAEKLLRNLTKSPSDDESGLSSSPSSTSSSVSSYSPSSSDTDNGANSEEEGSTEAPQNGDTPAEGGAPRPRKPKKRSRKKERKALPEQDDDGQALKRRKKAKWTKPLKSKEARLKEKQKEREKERQMLESELGTKSVSAGSYSPMGPQGAAKMKGLDVPRQVALRPQCLYHLESLLEQRFCKTYPNGMLRRGTVCSNNLRVEETFEFFLLCRFLNMFSSLLNVTWSFQELVDALSSPTCPEPVLATPPVAAAAEGDSASSAAESAGSSHASSVFVPEISPAGGNAPGGEKGEPGGVLRQILTKIFGFLGRRMTPGMSIARMCGRYVEEKRRDGIIPAGLLWPFDYPVKVWQSCDASGGAEKKKKETAAPACESERSDHRAPAAEDVKSTKEGGRAPRKNDDKKQGSLAGGTETNDVDGVLLESVYNPFKVCEDWRRLRSIHKLRLVRVLIEHAMSESPQVAKVLKGLTQEELEAGFKGSDEAGRLYWIVPQCGDPTVFKLYREDPHAQQLSILCEDISSLESIAEALGMEETTAGMSVVLLEAHQQFLIQEKQRSRELRRQKALSRQLEISNWGFVPASSRRERKAVDYMFSAYEASIEGRSSSLSGSASRGPSCAEAQRQDRSERLRARQARKEEQSAVAAVEAAKKDDGEPEEGAMPAPADEATLVVAPRVERSSPPPVAEAKPASSRPRPSRKRQAKASAVEAPHLTQGGTTPQLQGYTLAQQQQIMATLHQQQQHRLLTQQQQAAAHMHGGAGAGVDMLAERSSHAGAAPAYRQGAWTVEQAHQQVQRPPQFSAQVTPHQQALDLLRQRMDLLRQSLLQRTDLPVEQRQALYQQGWAQLSAEFTRMTGALVHTRDRAPASHEAQQAPRAQDERTVAGLSQSQALRERRLPVQSSPDVWEQSVPVRPSRAQPEHEQAIRCRLKGQEDARVCAQVELQRRQEARARAEAELQRQRLVILQEQQHVLRVQQQQMLLLRQQREQLHLTQHRVAPPRAGPGSTSHPTSDKRGIPSNGAGTELNLSHEKQSARRTVDHSELESLAAAGERPSILIGQASARGQGPESEIVASGSWQGRHMPVEIREAGSTGRATNQRVLIGAETNCLAAEYSRSSGEAYSEGMRPQPGQ
ncbi:hypothetical protein BESB_038870 [Besnoitia besnoiti]|uniref:Uncharacterized protein n=1 Tax=Besnoitia besnoiti TaxID=94643 RepID=A0A2A9MHQ5_BESBE|nr:hypothetical protein BESB_038870 [Besnoitia besnoiti]PFH37429.1 hypothetical protein BESB_038870 [Besnoitia besnoiti]